MKDNFTASLGFVLRQECVYAPGHCGDSAYVIAENVPGDAGGVTKWGIDQADHPGVDIRNLTFEQAAVIYQNGEWKTCMCDALPEGVDTAVFDAAVNLGCIRSAKLLQGAINECGYKVVEDGQIGRQTAGTALAICSIAALRPKLISELLEGRRSLYHGIVAEHPGDAKFLAGWLNRVDDLAKFLTMGGVA